MSSFSKFVAGSIVGGVIGAVIGLLLAPRSGRETRQIIGREVRERYDNSVDVVHRKYDETVHRMGEKVKVGVDESLHTLKEKAEQLKTQVKQISDDLEDAGRQAISRFTDKPQGE